jgi:hypothetical protein
MHRLLAIGLSRLALHQKDHRKREHVIDLAQCRTGTPVVFAKICWKQTGGPMCRELVALVGMSLMIGPASTRASAVSKRTSAAAPADVRALVRMMDKDQNGTVLKEGVPAIHGRGFDRLDLNGSGQLEPNLQSPAYVH